MPQFHRALPNPLHQRWQAEALWFGSFWRGRYGRWKPYERFLREVVCMCWSYGQALSHRTIGSKGGLDFSLDLISFFLTCTSVVVTWGRKTWGVSPVSASTRYCRRKNPLEGRRHHHLGFDRGDDHGRCLQGSSWAGPSSGCAAYGISYNMACSGGWRSNWLSKSLPMQWGPGWSPRVEVHVTKPWKSLLRDFNLVEWLAILAS